MGEKIMQSDGWCQVMRGDDGVRRKCINAMLNVNIEKVDAERITDAKMLEIRKWQSEKDGLKHCCVILIYGDKKRRVLGNGDDGYVFYCVPRDILEMIDSPFFIPKKVHFPKKTIFKSE